MGLLERTSHMNITKANQFLRATLLALAVGAFCAGSASAQVSIVVPPQSRTVAVGSQVMFVVQASGMNPLSYQWRKSGTPISGATQFYLTLNNVQIGDSGNYDVQVTNDTGSATSSAATLTVQQPVSITAQPQSKTVNVGASASFGVTATGTSLSYQWRKNGANLGGATSPTLALNNVQAADAGNYDVVVANAVSSAASSPATLTVLVAPTITTQPGSVVSMPFSTIEFTVAASGSAPLSYQWFKNGAVVGGNNMSGATTDSLTVYSISANDGGTYSVKVANSVGSMTSDNATLTVGPAITAQPVSTMVAQGATATFAVTAGGSAPLLFQWSFNYTPLAGQTAATLTLNNVQPDKAGEYRVTVSNPAGNVTSSAATLSVQSAPAITVSPQSYAAAEGESVTLSVGATGASYYQWNFQLATGDAYSAVAGGTGPTLFLSSVGAANAGNYTVTVRNSIGSVTSAAAQLTVSPQPKIVVQPQSQTVPPGINVTFSVTAVGRPPLSYQWFLNGAGISDATSAALSLTSVALADSGGLYTVVVSNASGSASSHAAHLTVSSAYAALGTLLWSLPTPAANPPAFGPDGTLYVDGVYAISPNGHVKWQFPSGKVGAVGADGTVYVINGGGGIAALDPNGNLLWSVSRGHVAQLALRNDGTLLCFGTAGALPLQVPSAFLLSRDGKNINIVAGPLPPSDSPTVSMYGAIAEDGTMYCSYKGWYDGLRSSSWDYGNLQAFDPDGSPYWNVLLQAQAYGSFCALTASGNLLLSMCNPPTSGTYGQPQLACYSPAGVKLWVREGDHWAYGATNLVIGLDGMIAVGDLTYEGNVTVLNQDGSLRWQAKPSDINPNDQVFTPALAADGTIYFTARFSLYAYDAYGGKAWQFSTRESVNSSPTVDPDGVVYFSTQKSLYAIKGASPLAASAWPVVGGNPRRTFLGTHPPAFTTVPQSMNVDYGATVVLTAAASGTPPLNFQWRHQGTNLPAATKATLTLTFVTAGDAGDYEVEVMNANTGLMMRSGASLGVAPPQLTYPITTSALPVAGGTTTGDGTFLPGSSRTVTATANTGYTFCNWTEDGNVVSTTSSYTFTLNANRTLVANFTPGACVQAPAGLIDWWRCEGNAVDSLGAKNGVLLSDVTTTAGRVGLALHFDGTTNSEVQIFNPPNPQSLSVEAWVSFDTLDSAVTSWPGLQYLVFCKNTRLFSFEGFTLRKARDAAGDHLGFEMTSADPYNSLVLSTNILTTNAWYHVVGTFDGIWMNLYLNGVLHGSARHPYPVDYGIRPMFFGTSGETAWDGRLAGALDEVSLYDRALTAQEVAALYGSGSSGKCPQTSGTPRFQLVTWRNGTISFIWPSTVGSTYQVQYTTNLSQANWVNLGNPMLATDSPLSVADTTGSDRQRFYRVVVMP
jgi:Concanavalin A-like lectin/glucanases superfamily/Divergent InlB B-repeat domain/Immunoglobulin I-set domain/Immunoglobulin domain